MSNMKRIFSMMFLSCLLSAPSLFAQTGLGGAFAYAYDEGANNMGGVLTLSTPVVPGTIQTVRLVFTGAEALSFAVTDDWWVIEEPISGDLRFYIGLGFYAGFTIDGNTMDVSLGGRAPLGLTVMPLDYLELFVEAAPCMGLGFEPEVHFPAFNAQAAVGFRLWF